MAAIETPDAAGQALLDRAMERLGLSAGEYHRVLRVARTLADLDGAGTVSRLHIAEALSWRRPVNPAGSCRLTLSRQLVDRGKVCCLGCEEGFQRRRPIWRHPPGSVEVAGQGARIPAQMPGNLRKGDAQGTSLGLQALSRGLGLRIGSWPRKVTTGPELGSHGLRLAFLPVDVCFCRNAHSSVSGVLRPPVRRQDQ